VATGLGTEWTVAGTGTTGESSSLAMSSEKPKEKAIAVGFLVYQVWYMYVDVGQ